MAPLLVSVLLLAGLDVKSQDTLHFYLDDFDKPMSKKFASKRMDVFKEHPGDELYRVERYILDPYKLDAVCIPSTVRASTFMDSIRPIT
ncbi:MAG: hypothetical protein JST02_08675 [Bacteroidetes bacterium]|nr:hypothetical protein [Bacteroidota bacterium]